MIPVVCGENDSLENGKLEGLKSSSNAATFPGVAYTFPSVSEETCQDGDELQGGEDLKEMTQTCGMIPAGAKSIQEDQTSAGKNS